MAIVAGYKKKMVNVFGAQSMFLSSGTGVGGTKVRNTHNADTQYMVYGIRYTGIRYTGIRYTGIRYMGIRYTVYGNLPIFAKNESSQNCPAWSAKFELGPPEYFAPINSPIAPI